MACETRRVRLVRWNLRRDSRCGAVAPSLRRNARRDHPRLSHLLDGVGAIRSRRSAETSRTRRTPDEDRSESARLVGHCPSRRAQQNSLFRRRVIASENAVSTKLERNLKMILVTGATGTVGREVVAQLLAAGEKVRAMTRNPVRATFDPRVEVVRGDFEDPASLANAVRSVERAFSLTLGPQTGFHERNLAQAGKAA